MKDNKIIYSLTIADIQRVAEEQLERKLSDEEIERVIDRIGDYINWYDAIEYSIKDIIHSNISA